MGPAHSLVCLLIYCNWTNSYRKQRNERITEMDNLIDHSQGNEKTVHPDDVSIEGSIVLCVLGHLPFDIPLSFIMLCFLCVFVFIFGFMEPIRGIC